MIIVKLLIANCYIIIFINKVNFLSIINNVVCLVISLLF